MVRQNLVGAALSLVALLSLVAALLPLIKGGNANVTFLGAAVVFFVISVAIRRRPPIGPPGA
jgi:hypothetical protein